MRTLFSNLLRAAHRHRVEPGEDGPHVRQLLTARKGQRPTVWMDWVEARAVMLKWSGYKFLVAERNM